MPPLALQAVIPGEDEPIVLLMRQQAINLQYGADSFSFDCSGRPFGAFWRGVNYRRSLDNRWLARWRPRARQPRQVHWLSEAESLAILEAIQALVRKLDAALRRGEVQPLGAAAHLSADDLARAGAALAAVRPWDPVALAADRDRFLSIYQPIGILPPDQYLALVLQATIGCSHNACTFCTFYRDRAFRIKGPDEFAAHIEAVLAFFGPSIALRRTIFLGDANALVIPFPRLRELFAVLARYVRIETRPAPPEGATLPPTFAGIYSFMDAFHIHRKSPAEWRWLQARGLRRVYIGMESGDDRLLRFLNKPGDAADVVRAVASLKAADIAVSVIILLGAGGEAYFENHVAHTVDALNAMPLGRGDLIYLSDFVELPGSEYGAQAAAAGIQPLSAARLRAQERLLRAGLRWTDPANAPRLARYDIREFLY